MPCGIVNNNNLIEKYFNAEKNYYLAQNEIKTKKKCTIHENKKDFEDK